MVNVSKYYKCMRGRHVYVRVTVFDSSIIVFDKYLKQIITYKRIGLHN